MKFLAVLMLFALGACANSPEHDDADHVDTVLTANTVCPISGNAVDEEAKLDVAGRPVYFCCEKCVAKGAEAPEQMAALAYPE